MTKRWDRQSTAGKVTLTVLVLVALVGAAACRDSTSTTLATDASGDQTSEDAGAVEAQESGEEPAPTSTPTTLPATTIPAVLPQLAFDPTGSPVNGQTRGVLVFDEGWVSPVLSAVQGGHRIWTPCGVQADASGGTFVETVDVVIDPGHGGEIETGAVGVGGLREADLNLLVARRVADELRDAGLTVVLTRDSDIRLPIVTRAEIARALQPKLFLSIHFNGGSTTFSRTPGTEMFFQYGNPESRRLAGLIYEEVFAKLSTYDTQWVALSDSGVIYRLNRENEDFYGVLRRTGDVTTVLIEYLYLSNPSEERLVSDYAVQHELAIATRKAVVRFLETDDPGSGFKEPMFRGYGSSGTGGLGGCDDPLVQAP